jgi:hypothetical protein
MTFELEDDEYASVLETVVLGLIERPDTCMKFEMPHRTKADNVRFANFLRGAGYKVQLTKKQTAFLVHK